MFAKKSSFDQKGVRLAYVGLAFLVALMYDFFLWGGKDGIGFIMFVLATLGLFITFIFRTKEDRQVWGLALIAPIIALSASLALFNNDLVRYFVPLAILILLILFFILYPLGNSERHGFVFSAIPLFKNVDLPFVKWAHIYRDLTDWRGGQDPLPRKIAKGLLIALPLLLIFGFLLSQADAVFAEWVGRLFNFKGEYLWRIFRTLAITLFASSLFYVVATEEHKLTHKEIGMRRLDPTVVSVVLVLLNFLFGVFVFIQFKYLFGDSRFVLSSNLTYAEYARAGFFQLVGVMVLSFFVLLFTYRSYSYNQRSWLVSVLQIFFLAQVLVIAASALKRMNLYQDQYGFTVLRLYVEWFIYFVILSLSAAGIFILLNARFKFFYQGLLALGTAALSVVCLLNVDNMITSGNIDRFLAQNKPLDIAYLRELSLDAMPAIQRLSEPGNLQRLSKSDIYELSRVIEEKSWEIGQRNNWSELNYGSLRAADSLLLIKEKTGKTFFLAEKQLLKFNEILNEATKRSESVYVYNEGYSLNKDSIKNPQCSAALQPLGLANKVSYCAVNATSSGQYIYILQSPAIFTNENSKNYGIDYALFKLSSDGRLQKMFEKHLDYSLAKVEGQKLGAVNDFPDYNDHNYSWMPTVYKKDGAYKVVNRFNLLPDGRLIESDGVGFVNYVYQAVPEAESVKFISKVIIEKL